MALFPASSMGRVKSATFSGTTTATGGLTIQNNWDGRIPVFATFMGASYRYGFFLGSDGTTLLMQVYLPVESSGTYYITAKANTAISGTYYYIE